MESIVFFHIWRRLPCAARYILRVAYLLLWRYCFSSVYSALVITAGTLAAGDIDADLNISGWTMSPMSNGCKKKRRKRIQILKWSRNRDLPISCTDIKHFSNSLCLLDGSFAPGQMSSYLSELIIWLIPTHTRWPLYRHVDVTGCGKLPHSHLLNSGTCHFVNTRCTTRQTRGRAGEVLCGSPFWVINEFSLACQQQRDPEANWVLLHYMTTCSCSHFRLDFTDHRSTTVTVDLSRVKGRIGWEFRAPQQ